MNVRIVSCMRQAVMVISFEEFSLLPHSLNLIEFIPDGALTVLQAVGPSSFVVAAVFEYILANPMAFAFHIFSLVAFSIGPGEFSMAAKLAQLPLALVHVAIRVSESSLSIALVVVEASLIDVAIVEGVGAAAELGSVHQLSLKPVSICIHLLASTVGQ